MIGHFEAHHALINIRFRLQASSDLEIECVVDTGFAGYLTLPMPAVSAMGLSFIRRMPINLADNSSIVVEVYVATILWNGAERETEVLATGVRPLIGTLLLAGNELNIQCADGGMVSVEPL